MRKLKKLTDSDYDILRKEAANFDENGHSSKAQPQRNTEVSKASWTSSGQQAHRYSKPLPKVDPALIKPRSYSKSTEVFRPRSQAAQAAWDGKQTLRPKPEVPRDATSFNKAGLSLHSAGKSPAQFFDERKEARSSTEERKYSPPQSPLRSKSSGQSGSQSQAPKPSRKP